MRKGRDRLAAQIDRIGTGGRPADERGIQDELDLGITLQQSLVGVQVPCPTGRTPVDPRRPIAGAVGAQATQLSSFAWPSGGVPTHRSDWRGDGGRRPDGPSGGLDEKFRPRIDQGRAPSASPVRRHNGQRSNVALAPRLDSYPNHGCPSVGDRLRPTVRGRDSWLPGSSQRNEAGLHQSGYHVGVGAHRHPTRCLAELDRERVPTAELSPGGVEEEWSCEHKDVGSTKHDGRHRKGQADHLGSYERGRSTGVGSHCSVVSSSEIHNLNSAGDGRGGIPPALAWTTNRAKPGESGASEGTCLASSRASSAW